MVENSYDFYAIHVPLCHRVRGCFATASVYLSREDSHLFQVVSDSKFVSVGVQSPTEINAPRGCAVIL